MDKKEFKEYLLNNKNQIKEIKETLEEGNYINPIIIVQKLEEVNKFSDEMINSISKEINIKEHLNNKHLDEIVENKYFNYFKNKTEKNYFYKLLQFYKFKKNDNLEKEIIEFIKKARIKFNIDLDTVESFH